MKRMNNHDYGTIVLFFGDIWDMVCIDLFVIFIYNSNGKMGNKMTPENTEKLLKLLDEIKKINEDECVIKSEYVNQTPNNEMYKIKPKIHRSIEVMIIFHLAILAVENDIIDDDNLVNEAFFQISQALRTHFIRLSMGEQQVKESIN